jgi:hypothetical protein
VIVDQAKKRPISITILSWLYIVVGALTTVAHFVEFRVQRPALNKVVWITVLGAAAIGHCCWSIRAPRPELGEVAGAPVDGDACRHQRVSFDARASNSQRAAFADCLFSLPARGAGIFQRGLI